MDTGITPEMWQLLTQLSATPIGIIVNISKQANVANPSLAAINQLQFLGLATVTPGLGTTTFVCVKPTALGVHTVANRDKLELAPSDAYGDPVTVPTDINSLEELTQLVLQLAVFLEVKLYRKPAPFGGSEFTIVPNSPGG